MKNVIAIILGILALTLVFSTRVEAGTCSSISRTNFDANQVLTSTELNNQFGTVYNAANALDGGCVTDGTLEIASTDSSWDNLKNYLHSGCLVSYSNTSTLSISECYLAVNGSFVSKTTATTVAFGCTSCSAEASATVFYVYVATGSSGTTLTPLILTTPPDENGYDSSGNKVLARFYNNQSQDIDRYSIDQWQVNKFEPGNTNWIDCGLVAGDFAGLGTVSGITDFCRRSGDSLMMNIVFTTGTVTVDEARINTKINAAGVSIDSNKVPVDTIVGVFARAVNAVAIVNYYTKATGGDSFMNFGVQSTGRNWTGDVSGLNGFGDSQEISLIATIPISGWQE